MRADEADFGPCCVCARTSGVRNVLMIHKKAPVAGQGWGCVVCDLPMDGALAVVCDACLAAHHPILEALRFACRGYLSEGRVPIGSLTGTHDHDWTKHAVVELEAHPTTQ